MMLRRYRLAALVGILAVSSAVIVWARHRAPEIPHFTWREIGTPEQLRAIGLEPMSPDSGAIPFAMNDRGDVVIQAWIAKKPNPESATFIWDGKGLQHVPNVTPIGLTGDRTIVGTDARSSQPVRVKDGTVTPLGSANDLKVLAVSESGVEVGSYHPRGTPDRHAMLIERGKMRDLGVPPERPFEVMSDGGPIGNNAWATAINDRGDVVGAGMHMFSWRPGLLWSKGKVKLLGHVHKDGNRESWEGILPRAINDSGLIVGECAGIPSAGCSYQGDQLNVIAKEWTPVAVNNLGMVVGGTSPDYRTKGLGSVMDRRAFLYWNGKTVELTEWVKPTGFQIVTALAITSKGEILCEALRSGDTSGMGHTLLLTPIS